MTSLDHGRELLGVINGTLLGFSLLLEVTLLAILGRRRLLKKSPLFPAILVFYLLRTVTVLATARLLPPLRTEVFSSALGLVDLALQLALGLSLFVRADGSGSLGFSKPHSHLQRTALFAANLVLASGLTLLLLQFLPSPSPIAVDRGVLLCGFYLPGLLAISRRSQPTRSLAMSVLTGFTILGLVNLLAQCGKIFAAVHRQPELFLFWAYLGAAVWLIVLGAWIQRFWKHGDALASLPLLKTQ